MIKTLSKGQEVKNFTDRSEPARFFGDGVQFKAKLIGILEVGEARGDRMCQEALQDLKMAIRAAGEHKQRITIHVTIDGLRLRDEKTGDSLYHHPVHKISFIAQDMHDSRAFGYIFGSPDSGHRFFGIKTDKAASQVVLAMRDLFQVVFELKKKEIELARQQIQSKIAAHEHQAIAQAVKNSTLDSYTKSAGESASTSKASPPIKSEKSPESVADLVDLEQELSSIQRGITQMERITPGEAPTKSSLDDDPFGDSFTKFSTPFNILPPPPESSRRHPKTSSKSALPTSEEQPPATAPKAVPKNATTEDWLNSPPHTSIVFPDIPKSIVDEFNGKTQEENIMRGVSSTSPSLANMISSISNTGTKYHDAFSELDPLKKPYVDKKFFFQDLKNPPKKVLRDLTATGQDSVFDVNFSGGQAPTTADLLSEFVDLNASGVSSANTSNSAILSNDLFTTKAMNSSSRKDESLTSISSNDFVDPFTNRDIDPFEDEEFCKLPVADPFENLHFPPSKSTVSPKTVTVLPDTKITTTNDEDDGSETLEVEKSSGDSVYNGPLQVNLPPESWANYISQKRLERQNSDGQQSGIARNRPSVFKQNTVDVISMKKMKPTNIFGQKFTKRDSNSINMRRLQESDSLSENEAAPEPPPRPDTSSQIAPPPLPPKKQFSDIVIRPSAARPSSGSSVSSRDSNRYDYVAAKLKSQQQQDAPPLPLPSRKVGGGRYESTFPGPGRPQKKPVDEDDYLTPISTLRTGDIPTLLPPPQKKDATKTRAPRKSSETDTRQLNDAERQRLSSTKSNEEPVPATVAPSPPTLVSTQPQPILPDITLSQLLTLGIDELAAKLKVPTSKLSTMTIVELTSYLSNFIEASKPVPLPPPAPVDRPMLAQMKNESPTPVFRVSFDEGGPNEVTFVAKFDDNFGDDPPFVANFDTFNQTRTSPQAPAVDRYAAFREIMGQDSSNEETAPAGKDDGDESGFGVQTTAIDLSLDKVVTDEKSRMSPIVLDEKVVKLKRIDTKITETIANAKDRYAALRDIIMVEDLFEKPPLASEESFTEQDDDNDCDDDDYDDATATFNTAKDNEEPVIVPASPEINITETNEIEVTVIDELADQQFNSNNLSSIFSATVNKDDIEIDEYMNRAISNLSLDSRVSPIIASKSPSAVSPVCRQTPQPLSKSPQPAELQLLSAPGGGQRKPSLNDMSTSPIPIAKSPSLNKSPVQQKSPMSSSKSPIPPTTPSQSSVNLEPSYKNISNSATRSPADDMICGSSPEYESGGKGKSQPGNTESWATFDQPTLAPPATGQSKKKQHMKSSRDRINKEMLDSPCSSDGKEEWKERGFSKKWPARGQTSSSSRDVSPWDEDDPEYRRRPRHAGPPPAPTSGSRYDHPRSLRRLNSGDDDFGYEEEMYDRRGRRIISRSRENFDSDSKSWYHSADHQNWSPAEEERCSFDRAAYERSTYGPPYEKREPKSLPMYDRRGGGSGGGAGVYDRRKYYRGNRSGHDYEYDDPYSESMGRGNRRSSGGKLRKDYDDEYDAHYEMANRGSRGDISRSRDYFYERDKRSFDRESNESYESAGGRRRKSFGSGDIYGERDRYAGVPHPEHTRSLRRGANGRNNARKKHVDDQQDSESDVMTGSGRRSGGSGEMSGSHRSSRQQKLAMEEDEVWGPSAGSGEFEPRNPGNAAPSQKPWNRPSSASESDRHLTDRNRVMMNPLSGSDGEDRRFRKKPRPGRGGKELDARGLHYATMRKYRANAGDEYYDCEEPGEYGSDEEQNGQMRPRHDDYDDDGGSYYGRRGPYFRGSTSRLEGNSQDRGSRYAAVDDIADRKFRKSNSRDFYTDDRESQRKYGEMASPKSSGGKHVRIEFDFENFPPTATTPQSSAASNNKKFNFEESGEGFESDFLNSPPAAPANSGGSGSDRQKTFRFSNDFSDKDSPARQQQQQNSAMFSFDADFANNSTKLRFNETVKVSKAEKSPVASRSPAPAAQAPLSIPVAVASFEDDFSSKTSFDELEDQWNPEIPKKNNNSSFKMRQKQQDNIKKSESINIFAKKADPFDDPFFEETKNGNGSDNNNSGRAGNAGGDFSGWNRNFANFEDNS